MPDYCEVKLSWTGEKKGFPGRLYSMVFKGQTFPVSIMRIKERIGDPPSSSVCRDMIKNQTYLCTLVSEVILPINPDEPNATFLLFENRDSEVLAQGSIQYRLRRSDNIRKENLTVTRKDREKLNRHKGKVIWLTGLSGSGKTTLANALEVRLHSMSCRTYILDGDNVRHGLNSDLGFTDADRIENMRRITEVAKIMLDAGLVVIAAFISPFRKERRMAQQRIGKENFIGVYVKTPLETCEKRDVKGLYKKARQGDLPNMSGIGSLYEEPVQPDLVVSGEGEENLSNAVEAIIKKIIFFDKCPCG